MMGDSNLNNDRIPTLLIQSDWEDFMQKQNAEVWISAKYRGETGIHGKLRAVTGQLPTPDSNTFSVITCDENTLWLQHQSGFSCLFIAPRKTFSKIHKKSVLSLDVSTGGLGVSVCSDNKLSVWDADTGEVRRLLEGHVCDVYKTKLFPSGIVVLSGGADMQLKIWSADTGACPVTLRGHKAAITDFCIVDLGRNIISVGKDGTARLWDCGEAKLLDTLFQLDVGIINCCSIGVLDEQITINERDTSEREVGTKNKLLLMGTEAGEVLGLTVYNRKTLFSIKLDSAINAVAYITKQCFLVGCQDGQVVQYNPVRPSQPVRFWYESNSPVLSFGIYKNLGVFVGRNDGTVTYIHVQPNDFHETRVQLTGSDCDPIYDIAVSGDQVFTGCRDGKVRSYQVGRSIKRIYNL